MVTEARSPSLKADNLNHVAVDSWVEHNPGLVSQITRPKPATHWRILLPPAQGVWGPSKVGKLSPKLLLIPSTLGTACATATWGQIDTQALHYPSQHLSLCEACVSARPQVAVAWSVRELQFCVVVLPGGPNRAAGWRTGPLLYLSLHYLSSTFICRESVAK